MGDKAVIYATPDRIDGASWWVGSTNLTVHATPSELAPKLAQGRAVQLDFRGPSAVELLIAHAANALVAGRIEQSCRRVRSDEVAAELRRIADEIEAS